MHSVHGGTTLLGIGRTGFVFDGGVRFPHLTLGEWKMLYECNFFETYPSMRDELLEVLEAGGLERFGDLHDAAFVLISTMDRDFRFVQTTLRHLQPYR